ncbi:hypothetical protein GCM10022393_05940 [Aquimarina addita]|uniref:Uncharacterized protein n=1 Tax=Aquimarina addita TaxID=870485 RepID=A0ABP7XAR1_9FLAO
MSSSTLDIKNYSFYKNEKKRAYSTLVIIEYIRGIKIHVSDLCKFEKLKSRWVPQILSGE